jgi:hypothetical protein
VQSRGVRLTISDELRRGHGSVFFRAWFAVPLLIWLALWAIVAAWVAFLNWWAVLADGRSPPALHRFLERFVRFATHTYAYLYLCAEPLPAFDGKPRYPIDVQIEPPPRQSRWGVAFRSVLCVPALLLLVVVAGVGPSVYGLFAAHVSSAGASLLAASAFLGWFYALARGRVPRGLRDLGAYALSYAAQFWAYLLLLTDRYPSSDPHTAIGPLPTRTDPVWLETREDQRRSRLTTFFRLPLAFPHLVWLALWSVIALVAGVLNWLCTLVAGVSPPPLHRFLAAYVRYALHVSAYLFLVGAPFPGFTGAEGRYPLDLHVAAPVAQNRWSVLFRLVFVLPAWVLAGAYGSLLFVVAVLAWFASLATGRMPSGLRNAGALALRYNAQANAYLLLLTDSYPYSGPCLHAPAAGGEGVAPGVAPAVA